MARVTVVLAMSSDGFIAGPNDGKGLPLGGGGEALFDWPSSGRDATSGEQEGTVSDTGTTRGMRTASAAGRRRVLKVALWALQVLLAVVFAMAGLSKVFGDPAMVDMFATIGVGQWFRYLVGMLEISGAVGVLIPRLSALAALGLACLMVGATLTNLFALGVSPLPTVGLLVASALVAWGRSPQTGGLLGGSER